MLTFISYRAESIKQDTVVIRQDGEVTKGNTERMLQHMEVLVAAVRPVAAVMPQKARPPVSRDYTERPEIQICVQNALFPTEKTRKQCRCVLHGLGGSGKSQIALFKISENEEKSVV